MEAGILGPEDRVELLEGEIVNKMGQDIPHIDGINLLTEVLREVLGTGYLVRTRLPIKAGDEARAFGETDAITLEDREIRIADLLP